MLTQYDRLVHPVGETLPTIIRVFRVKTVTAFLKSGVALSKVDCFRDLLEENGYVLSSSQHLRELTPPRRQIYNRKYTTSSGAKLGKSDPLFEIVQQCKADLMPGERRFIRSVNFDTSPSCVLYCVYTGNGTSTVPGHGASTVINGDSTRLHCRFVCACACACQIKILITYNP